MSSMSSDSDVDDPEQLSDDGTVDSNWEDATSTDLEFSDDDSWFNETFNDDEDLADDGEWRRVVDRDVGTQPVPFTATPGPKHMPPNDAKPIYYFNLLFTDTFIDKLVEETNRYSDQCIGSREEYLVNHPHSRIHQWIREGHTTIQEIRAFLGVIFNMGIIKKPTIESYWMVTPPSMATPWFPQHFNRNRFQLLLKFLHFNDNSLIDDPHNPDYNVLYKIHPLIDHFQAKFTSHFHPDKNISLDESMIAFKGKTPNLRQYMPNKHHARFGIKLWCVCDTTTGYTCSFEVYTGKARRPAGGNLTVTHATAIRLLNQAGLLNLGHNVGFDNFFSSPALFLHLYQCGTTATGTVRRNRVGLPEALQETRVLNNEVAEWRQGSLLCVKYKDGGKEPVLISTSCTAGFSQVTNRRRQRVSKPKIVIEYNKIMGGVDLKDRKLYDYLSERRTLKWTTKVAFYFFGTAMLNCYIIYRQHTRGRVLPRLQFMLSIIEELVSQYEPHKVRSRRRTREELAECQRRPLATIVPTNNPSPGLGPHTLRKLPKKKLRDCVAGHDRRVRSNYICARCDVGLCVTCFHRYHNRAHH